MDDDLNPRSTASIFGHPIHTMLNPVPITCFVGALLTDIVYAQTADMQWANFSVWLLTIGLLVSAVVALTGIIDWLGDRRIRRISASWVHGIVNGMAILLSIVNAFVHSRDAYTSVVPTGLILSAIVVVLAGHRRMERRRASSIATASACDRSPVDEPSPSLDASWPRVHGRLDGLRPQADRSAQAGRRPTPTSRRFTSTSLPPMKVTKVVGWQGAKPTLPAGMQVEALATGLKSPRSVYVLPNGDVLIAESGPPPSPAPNRPKDIVMGLLQMKAHSGRPSRASASPSSGWTPAAQSDSAHRPNRPPAFAFRYGPGRHRPLRRRHRRRAAVSRIRPGRRRSPRPASKLTALPGGPIDHHWTKSLTASPDGTKLYAGVGSNSNITENGIAAETGRAQIWEIDRVTGAHRPYATGLRNPNGLSFEPTTHVLWAVVNERDELGPDLVPDYLTSVKDGAFYGWPWSYWGQHVDPRVMPQNPAMVAKAIMPDYSLSSHVAPLGMTFSTGSSLPATYRGGAFVGEHGSWDRSPLNGYKVVYIPFAAGRPNGMAQDVVTGFANTKNQARGRPVGLAMDNGGGLLIADDVGGTVWRVTGVGSQTVASR